MTSSSKTRTALFDTPGMPLMAKNANLDCSLVMRVGLPHCGGSLVGHAFNKGYAGMVSASAFWDRRHNVFRVPRYSNLEDVDFALDSAGYTAMKLWKEKGTQPGIAGIYPWKIEQYVELAGLCGASWWSQPDFCVEPEIAGTQGEVDYRINATATMLEGTLRVVHAWHEELSKECSPQVVMNMLSPPVPVLQGWSSDDYLRSLDLLMTVWSRWWPWLDAPALIGLGSVCRRTLKHPTHGLKAILARLEGALPTGCRLHLFGVKGEALAEVKMLDFVASADSMAYDFGARVKAHRRGISNTVVHRSAEMSEWMTAAARRIQPSSGDQFRMAFTA